MNKRNLLRTHLLSAWKKTIQGPYQSQQINSEHGLQVYFCMHLLNEFKSHNEKNSSGQSEHDFGIIRRIFVEPHISLQRKEPESKDMRLFPDVLICNRDKIICVIELKYLPRGRASFKKNVDTLRASFKKDLNTLKEIYESQKNDEVITIVNERFLGKHNKETTKSYSLANDAIFCWAGVYTGERYDLSKEKEGETIGNCFLQMDAITEYGEDPKIYPKIRKPEISHTVEVGYRAIA